MHNNVVSSFETTPVYLDEVQYGAFNVIKSNSEPPIVNNLSSISINDGTEIKWYGKVYKIINTSLDNIALLTPTKDVIEISRESFYDLHKKGVIESKTTVNIIENQVNKKEELISQARSSDLEIANVRYEAIQMKLAGESIEKIGVPKSTLRDWLRQYREAELAYGSGYLGLIPQIKKRGNRNNKLPEETIQLINEFIEKDYETIKQKTMIVVYGALCKMCKEKGIIEPSYTTFAKFVKQRPLAQQIENRKGKRAAYKFEQVYDYLSMKTPRHGEKVFHIAHIDHTQLDIELVDSRLNQTLGRPWLSLMVDAYSRTILAFYITFDEPSYRSIMMLFRECVKRHNRLPKVIVVDKGKEFGGVYFESLLAQFEITKKSRPSAKARFGSVIERIFGTANTTLIHNLQGNTQIMKEVRQVTKSVNPKNHAIWDIQTLYNLFEGWINNVYHQIEHPALGQTPAECFAQNISINESLPHTRISYDKSFIIATLPVTKRQVAKVHPGKGIKIDCKYYWTKEFRNPKYENKKVPVKYEPYNIGIAYAYIENSWIECKSEYYEIFKGHTEKELEFITTELRKRQKNHSKNVNINAKMIASYIQTAEEGEEVMRQRIKDNETKNVRSLEKFEELNMSEETLNHQDYPDICN